MALKRRNFPFADIEKSGNLVQVFLNRAAFFGDKKALFYKVKGHSFESYSWQEWMQFVKETAMALYAMGIRKGDYVGILSENCPEWTFADLGCMSLGAITVPIYPTSSTEDIRYIIEHAKVKVVFVSNENQARKIQPFQSIFCTNAIIVFYTEGMDAQVSFKKFLENGRSYEASHQGFYEQCVKGVGADDLATIIYTSGTTGKPKGVVLTHRNFIENCVGSHAYVPLGETDIVLSVLPLSHVFERVAGYYFAVMWGAHIAYAESLQTVEKDILFIHPTIVFTVPRFFEKAYSRILEASKKASPVVRLIFNWAISIGTVVSERRQAGVKAGFRISLLYFLARLLVLNKIKFAFGNRIRFFVSGGAPLSQDLERFFHASGILILQGYGLTETSPVIAVNSPNNFRFGSVGRPIPNIKVRIAEDGEILTAGPCVMRGYFNDPQATAECIRDGWFHTGDIGHFDENGFLHITDRKKDIIVTAGGKNISPQNIENRILADSLFLQAVVVGDKRSYLCALLVPHKADVLEYARQHPCGSLPYEEILKHPSVNEWIQEHLDATMDGLANYETVKAFILLPQEFTQAGGELTPTQKIKRRVVMKEYQKEIDELYRKTDEEWAKRKLSLLSEHRG